MPAHQRLRIGERGGEDGHGVGIAAVAERHGGVAEKAAPLRAGHRRLPEARAEARLVEREQRGQVRRQRLGAGRVACLPVPRARLLAEVAAEDPVAELRAQLHGERAPVLDGQVREAAARVHGVAGPEGAGRAGGVAAGAGPAVIGGQR